MTRHIIVPHIIGIESDSSAIQWSHLAQQVDGRVVEGNLVDSFEQGPLAQQVDGRIVEGNLVDSFEQGPLAQQPEADGRVVEGKLVESFEQGLFTVEAIEQQALPIALVEQPSFLVNSAV